MNVIEGRNVQQIFPKAIQLLAGDGGLRVSRNGLALSMSGPVTTSYWNPTERVLFHHQRDANPFFHFFEALWMLAGCNDVEFPASIVSSIAQYSDDGKTFNGAYGHRWRNAFGFDQLTLVIDRLKSNPNDRRQIVSMWDGERDLINQNTKDVPCNLQIAFRLDNDGCLMMTVFNRSNDIVWGCYGANAVHFSMLHEFMAHAIGVPVGVYYQVSNDWHGYLNTFEPLVDSIYDMDMQYDPYQRGEVKPFPMVAGDYKNWLQECQMFVSEQDRAMGYTEPLFRKVAIPMWKALQLHKRQEGDRRENLEMAITEMLHCQATDWRKAGIEWLQRRLQKLS